MFAKPQLTPQQDTPSSTNPRTGGYSQAERIQELTLPAAVPANPAASARSATPTSKPEADVTREELIDLIKQRLASAGFSEYKPDEGKEPSHCLGWTSDSGFNPQHVTYFSPERSGGSPRRPIVIAFAVTEPGNTVYWRQAGESQWHPVSDGTRYVFDTPVKAEGWARALNSLADELEQRQTPSSPDLISPNADLFLEDPVAAAAMFNDDFESFVTYVETIRHEQSVVSILEWDSLRDEYANWPGPKVEPHRLAVKLARNSAINALNFRRREGGGLEPATESENDRHILEVLENAFNSKKK